jgi:hypothetical protein
MIFAGRNISQAITGRRRGIHYLGHACRTRAFKYTNRTQHVGGHVVDRPLDGGNNVANAGEVENELCPAEWIGPGIEFADVEMREGDEVASPVCRDIFRPPTDQVVDHLDPESARYQQVHHVGPDEARTARDHRQRRSAHRAPIFFMVRML